MLFSLLWGTHEFKDLSEVFLGCNLFLWHPVEKVLWKANTQQCELTWSGGGGVWLVWTDAWGVWPRVAVALQNRRVTVASLHQLGALVRYDAVLVFRTAVCNKNNKSISFRRTSTGAIFCQKNVLTYSQESNRQMTHLSFRGTQKAPSCRQWRRFTFFFKKKRKKINKIVLDTDLRSQVPCPRIACACSWPWRGVCCSRRWDRWRQRDTPQRCTPRWWWFSPYWSCHPVSCASGNFLWLQRQEKANQINFVLEHALNCVRSVRITTRRNDDILLWKEKAINFLVGLCASAEQSNPRITEAWETWASPVDWRTRHNCSGQSYFSWAFSHITMWSI